MKATLISITKPVDENQTLEGLIAYIARVSSKNQDNPNYEELLLHCILNKHWSVFEQGFLTIEIETSRAISHQMIRHKSFFVQEFSQRYQTVFEFEEVELREQDKDNRQSSTKIMNDDVSQLIVDGTIDYCADTYNHLISSGVAKECARFILPECTQTKIYFTGSIRSWIHYLMLRTDSHTQKEHRLVADACLPIFTQQLPTIGKILSLLIKVEPIITLRQKSLIYSLLGKQEKSSRELEKFILLYEQLSKEFPNVQ